LLPFVSPLPAIHHHYQESAEEGLRHCEFKMTLKQTLALETESGIVALVGVNVFIFSGVIFS
jgi:hypothetical protein